MKLIDKAPAPTVRLYMHESERPILAMLGAFGMTLLEGLGGRVVDEAAASTELTQRALSFVTKIPLNQITAEIVKLEWVADDQPLPSPRMERILVTLQ